jgi:outer membrane protein assembly factor BamE
MQAVYRAARAARLTACAGLSIGLAALGGCAAPKPTDNLFGLITPYRIEVVQGNVITKEMAAAVKVGMSRAQVRDVLGSPLLADIFHADRWDYVFTIRRQGTAYQQRRATALFDGDNLKSFEADELPTEREFVVSIDTQRKRAEPPPLALNDAQVKALPPPAKPSATPPASAAPLGAVRPYPPLEAAAP